MADNELILDKDVRRIAGVRLVPSLRGPWEVYYEVVFVDGRVQQRPLSAIACPDAIGAFEGRYFASAHRDGPPGTRRVTADDEDAKSESIAESHSRDEGSDADDRHLDYIPSDDSLWDDIVDSQGRSARSPTIRAAIRAKMSARDETFRSPSKSESDSDVSTKHGSSSKASATTAEPRSATKSVGSATSDSLLLEAAPKGASVGTWPNSKRPIRPAAARGLALRRHATRLQLDVSDDDLFADVDIDGTGFSPGKKMAKLSVKEEVVDNDFADDHGPDPWGGVKAADPWTQPAPDACGGNISKDDSCHLYRPERSHLAEPQPLSQHIKPKKEIGVVGSLFAEYFARQAKGENISADGNVDNKGFVVGKKRKRPLKQGPSATSKNHAVDGITLSDHEDSVPRLPAKKSKKSETNDIVYVLSSDSEDSTP